MKTKLLLKLFVLNQDEIPKDDMKASSPVDSTLTQEDPEEKSDEEIDLTEDLTNLSMVNAVEEQPQQQHRSDLLLAVAPRDEAIKKEPIVAAPVAEVSLLDSKVDEGMKVENDGGPRKTSHGFMVNAGEGADSGSASAGRGPPPPKEQQQEPQPPPVNAVPTAKTYANLFKNDAPPAQISRNPFPPAAPAIKKEPVTSPGSSAVSQFVF